MLRAKATGFPREWRERSRCWTLTSQSSTPRTLSRRTGCPTVSSREHRVHLIALLFLPGEGKQSRRPHQSVPGPFPAGVSPSEGEAFAGDLLDPSATGALQDAMKDIMEALNVPVVPGGSAEQAVDAAGQGSTVGTMWQSINHIAEQLMAQFQSTPGLGSLPFAGRVLAYVLAIVGVGFLMREAFPKSEEANEGEAKASAESASESSASPTKMEWPPLASEADEADLPPIEPQVLDPHAAEAEEHSVNDHIDIQVDTIDVGSAFADDASSSDNGNESPSQDKSPVFANANAPSGQLAMVEEDSTYPSPVLPWMDEDPAGWGPADMDEFSVLDVKIPEPSLAPAIRSSVPETPVAAEAKVPPEPPMKKAQDPEEVADLDDERARDMDTLAEKRVLSTELRAERGLLKEKLWWVVRGLGPTAAVVPGGEPVRFDIDDLIEKLERITPLETPLNIQADSEEYKYMTVRSKAHPHLLGSWRLEYASNTQVQTDTNLHDTGICFARFYTYILTCCLCHRGNGYRLCRKTWCSKCCSWPKQSRASASVMCGSNSAAAMRQTTSFRRTQPSLAWAPSGPGR